MVGIAMAAIHIHIAKFGIITINSVGMRLILCTAIVLVLVIVIVSMAINVIDLNFRPLICKL